MADNHGNTPAAWTGVLVSLLGFAVGSAGVMLSPLNYVLLWVGIALVIAGGVVFVVMDKLGLHTSGHSSGH